MCVSVHALACKCVYVHEYAHVLMQYLHKQHPSVARSRCTPPAWAHSRRGSSQRKANKSAGWKSQTRLKQTTQEHVLRGCSVNREQSVHLSVHSHPFGSIAWMHHCMCTHVRTYVIKYERHLDNLELTTCTDGRSITKLYT